MAAGGVGEATLGAGLLLTLEPTGLTKIGGGALFLHGADLTAAGLKQLWINQSVQTFTSQIVSGGLITTGVPSPYANLVGGLTEIGMATLPIGIVGKAGVAARGTKGIIDVTSKPRILDTALVTAEKWLKPGYTEIGKPGSGVYRSADGLRQFRMSATDIGGGHGKIGPHVHFEKFSPTGEKLKNIHTPLIFP